MSQAPHQDLRLPLPAVSASVSCMDLGNLNVQISEVDRSPVSFYHYDVVDGRFNRCLILGDLVFDHFKRHCALPIEVHLAVNDIEPYIDIFARKGADYIAVHYEAMERPLETFAAIRAAGAQPILAFRAETAPDEDFLALAKECPWILKLTVNPGFSGQQIQPRAIEHIKAMRSLIDAHGLATRIQVDGNVNASTIRTLAEAGGTIFTGGTSGLFVQGHTVEENVRQLLEPAKEIFGK